MTIQTFEPINWPGTPANIRDLSAERLKTIYTRRLRDSPAFTDSNGSLNEKGRNQIEYMMEQMRPALEDEFVRKVIQLNVDLEEYNGPVLLIEEAQEFHTGVLESFVKANGKRVVYANRKNDRVVAPHTSWYELVGAGISMFRNDGTVLFGGESVGYNIGIDKAHLTLCDAINQSEWQMKY